MVNSINIKIGGQAGEGIKTTGLIFSKSLSRLGFKLFGYDEYPSLIRGGHNTFQLFISPNEVFSQHKDIDILIAFDEETANLQKSELRENGVILYDPAVFQPQDIASEKFIAIPWTTLATEKTGSKLAANVVSLGAALALMGLPVDSLTKVLGEIFTSKKEGVISGNQQAAQAGYDYVKQHVKTVNFHLTQPELAGEQMVMLGNEAIGLGAIASGVKYFAGYPMTPVTALLHFMAQNAHRHNIVVHHVENEIAAINTLIGASVLGVRVMTATSGGGFCLMVEGMGMMGGAEIPGVIVLGSRPGPSTGLPTWTGQADLRFAIHAAQDEFPRVVLAPGNVWEAYELTRKAFMLAEKYQLPVVIIVDKYLCESYQNGKILPSSYRNERLAFAGEIKGDYRRYALTDSGVSPRPFLGQKNGAHLTNSYEHSQNGFSTENSKERIEQVQKRLKKLDSLKVDLWDLPLFGPPQAKTTLVGFGSTMGPAQEALKDLPDTNYLHFNYAWPYPDSAHKILSSANHVICLEGNGQGQLQGLIEEHSGIRIANFLRKFDGRPFYPEEIVEFVKNHG